jgi:hypothetical protein
LSPLTLVTLDFTEGNSIEFAIENERTDELISMLAKDNVSIDVL